MSEYKTRIREFFSRFFQTDRLEDGDDIFAGGYVNSLFAMQLISWLEKSFSITIEDEDLQITNFNSIDTIGAFVTRKQALASETRDVIES